MLTPNIFNGYGSTEAFWNCFLRPYDLPEKAGSTGRSCTDDDVAVVKIFPDRLAEPDELVAKDNHEVGEIIVKSPGKCSFDYINRDEETQAKYMDGWLYVGDLGPGMKTSSSRWPGAKDDMIISGGRNIQPVAVEEAHQRYPKVSEERWWSACPMSSGGVVVAYVVPRDSSLTGELNEFCARHPMLARYKRPRYLPVRGSAAPDGHRAKKSTTSSGPK